ncbi:MAG: hypothetical protein AAFX02_09570 [Pseudomonadota bacterium]
MTSLTPVERSVLIALKAAGGPLRESADLNGRLKIGMAADHRDKLLSLALIETEPSPFTHKLTAAGNILISDLLGKSLSDDEAAGDVDLSIAIALQDLPGFSARKAKVLKSVPEDQQAAVQQLALSAESVFQHIKRAASKQSIQALHNVGDEVPFDAALFDAFDELLSGFPVTVTKQPIVKATSTGELLLLRGVAESSSEASQV